MTVSAGKTQSPRRRLPGGKGVAVWVLVLACCPLLAAQTPAGIDPPSKAASATPPPTASSRALPDCIISPDDVLTINVYDAPDVTGEYRVSPTGQIEIPLLSAPIVTPCEMLMLEPRTA